MSEVPAPRRRPAAAPLAPLLVACASSGQPDGRSGWMAYDGRMADGPSVIHSDPVLSGGVPVLRGTRVPVQSLFDYLEGGETLHQFLAQFPSVSKRQALAVLDLAGDSLLARARSA